MPYRLSKDDLLFLTQVIEDLEPLMVSVDELKQIVLTERDFCFKQDKTVKLWAKAEQEPYTLECLKACSDLKEELETAITKLGSTMEKVNTKMLRKPISETRKKRRKKENKHHQRLRKQRRADRPCNTTVTGIKRKGTDLSERCRAKLARYAYEPSRP